MKNHFRLFIGFVYFLIVLGPNVFAQDQSVEKSVFDPIKFQMRSITEKNSALAKKNKTLKAQLISLQLAIEKHEQERKGLDPEISGKMQYSREQSQAPSAQPLDHSKDINGTALIEEAQDLYLMGQHLDLDEGQSLRELQLYDLQYQKQELELDLQDKQALYEEVKEQRHKELQIVEEDFQERVREEKDMRLKVADEEKKMLTYTQDIDLLKIENETLRKKIEQLRK